jgi:hypothetical protein
MDTNSVDQKNSSISLLTDQELDLFKDSPTDVILLANEMKWIIPLLDNQAALWSAL